MNVIEIVREHLILHGYDGLFYCGADCACELSDLVPCGEINDDCVAGYKQACDCDECHDFHIGEKKGE